jgi:hypothetical protein
MKYIYGFILLSFCCANSFAQTSPVRTQLKTVFANINKAKCPPVSYRSMANHSYPLMYLTVY